MAAADAVMTFCMPGGHFGDGLIDVRRVCAETGIVDGYVQIMVMV